MRRRLSSIDFGRSGGRMAHALIEDSLRLDLSHPAVRKIVGAAQAKQGAFHWDDVAAVGYIWRPGARVLELRFSAAGASVIQQVRVSSAPARFGGRRLWFHCPETLAPTRALFLPPGRRRWAGRVAHNLAYASQRTRPDIFTRLARDLDRNDAADRRNHVRRLRWRERAAEARRR